MPRTKASNIDRQIGSTIARLRTMRGMSQEALGAALQTPVTRQAVIKWEDGRTRVDASLLVEIAGVLGFTLGALFEGVDKLLPKSNTAVGQVDRMHEAMFRQFNKLPSDDMREAVSNLTRAIVIATSKNLKGEKP